MTIRRNVKISKMPYRKNLQKMKRKHLRFKLSGGVCRKWMPKWTKYSKLMTHYMQNYIKLKKHSRNPSPFIMLVMAATECEKDALINHYWTELMNWQR